MRSVVVVLPASMWAMMPMLRYRSSGVTREHLLTSHPSDDVALPVIVRERAVGFRHPVRVFALLDGRAAIVRCVHQLAGQAGRHGHFGTGPGGVDQPAH